VKWGAALGLAVFLALLTWGRIALVQDSGWLMTYVDLADRGAPAAERADVSPAYLTVVTLLRRAGLVPADIRALHVGSLTVAAVFCALAARRLGGWIAATATAMLILGSRSALVVAAELDPKALIFLLTSIGLFGLVTRRPLVTGLALGLSAVTHPYGYLMLLVALVWQRRGSADDAPPHVDNAGKYGGALTAVAAAVPIALVLLLAKVAPHASSQFYEGNNPLATGCAGVAPRVVIDMQAKLRHATPDRVYRLIAEGAGGDPATYWRGKAMAFLRHAPGAATRVFAQKALLTVHHYEVYDLMTAKRLALSLSRYPAIPFGIAFALAIASLVLRRERRPLVPLAVFALVLACALTVFVVSARQRNVLLAPLAILGGTGVAEVVALARGRSERALIAFGALLIGGSVLGIETPAMREYEHAWRSTLRLPIDPESPPHVFDAAVAHARNGRWSEADSLLASLGDYRPLRQNAAVASVAYYRARAAIAVQRPPAMIVHLVHRASTEAPGDPHVLALRAMTVDRRAAQMLDELHDPLTRDAALAIARHATSTKEDRSGSSGAGR
jgi:hypothetical protein